MTSTATIHALPVPAPQSPVSASNFPALPNSKPLLRHFLPDVAAETGYDLSVVETVADGYALSMRRDDPARYGLKLLAHLEYCAKVYCGAGSTAQDVYSECADFVMTHYGHLGVDEIRQAFALASACKLNRDDEPVNIRAYHGAFTVLMLGDLLDAYTAYRNPVLQKVVDACEVSEGGRRISERDAYWRSEDGQKELQALRDERIRALVSNRQDIRTVHVSDYDLLESRGLLMLTTGQKWALMERARACVCRDAARERGRADCLRSLGEFVRPVGDGGDVANYARCLAVLEWIEVQRFVATGEATEDRIRAIAGRIERCEGLSDFERDVYAACAQRVEDSLRRTEVAAPADVVLRERVVRLSVAYVPTEIVVSPNGQTAAYKRGLAAMRAAGAPLT